MKIIKNKEFIINVTDKLEEDSLNLIKDKYFKLKKINNEVYAIVFSNNENKKIKQSSQNIPSTKNKILNLLNDKNLEVKDKVEGTFENLLNPNELSIFKQMLKNKEIIIFKLSKKYKKGIYKVFEQKNKNFTPVNYSNISFDFFENNNYYIIENNNDAIRFSEKYASKIKNNEIIGVKSFDGNYYVIDYEYYSEIKDKFLSVDLPNNFTLIDVMNKTEFSEEIIKIVLEILKDQGVIIEKRKGIYEFI
jgi:hypothetical protein